MKFYRTKALLKLLELMYCENRDKYISKRFEPDNKPWMRYREIEIIKEILKKLKPKACLEWGAGYSTLYFPQFLANSARWFSVEHDKTWTEKIKALNANNNVAITCVEPNHFPWTDELNDGSYSDLTDYIEYPLQHAPYDFVLIDGRARNFCVKKAYELVSADGLVLLHDDNRPHYRQETGIYPQQFLLKCYR